jgi:uncharacterized protein YndB with AHSA1/START domain
MTEHRGSETASASEKLVFECTLADAPEKVWRALTTPELIAAWLAPNDFRAEQGARFFLDDTTGEGGRIDCKVLAIEPPRLISYSWRDGEASSEGVDSVVTFELARIAEGGTRLKIVHQARQAEAFAVQPRPTVMAANSNTPSAWRMAA